jgi:Raf kinase inhibitor-like YbhB/YbcL family protein
VSLETTTTTEVLAMEVTSPAFEQGEPIPLKYSCDGENVSPHLDVAKAPAATTVLFLIMDDPDAPGGCWDHWIAYDISPSTTIEEGEHDIGTGGLNSWQETGYGGPCPPSGVHRYFFRVLALDTELGLADGASKADVLTAMEGHILADATLMGTFTFDS